MSKSNSLNVQDVTDVIMEDNSQIESFITQNNVPEETDNFDISVPEKSSQVDVSVTENNIPK